MAKALHSPSRHGTLRHVLKLLTAAGLILTILGLILIPLPGPGMLLVVPGVLLLAAAIIVRFTTGGGNRRPTA